MSIRINFEGQCLVLLFAASHSFKSSPSGRITASWMFPLPSNVLVQLLKSCRFEFDGCLFTGLKVSFEHPKNSRNISLQFSSAIWLKLFQRLRSIERKYHNLTIPVNSINDEANCRVVATICDDAGRRLPKGQLNLFWRRLWYSVQS